MNSSNNAAATPATPAIAAAAATTCNNCNINSSTINKISSTIWTSVATLAVNVGCFNSF